LKEKLDLSIALPDRFEHPIFSTPFFKAKRNQNKKKKKKKKSKFGTCQEQARSSCREESVLCVGLVCLFELRVILKKEGVGPKIGDEQARPRVGNIIIFNQQ
jgi:hypothetical protein